MLIPLDKSINIRYNLSMIIILLYHIIIWSKINYQKKEVKMTRIPKWMPLEIGSKVLYGTRPVTVVGGIKKKDGSVLIEYEDQRGVRHAAFAGSFEKVDPYNETKLRYKKLDKHIKAILRSFVKDLHDILESSIDNKTYLIRKATPQQGGQRLIIYDPLNPKRAKRYRIWRGGNIAVLIERAVFEAFGKLGLVYYEEYIKEGGFSEMAEIRERIKPKKQKKGVRRKKVNENGPMIPLCAWGQRRDEQIGGKSLVCVQRLKTVKEFEEGLCITHIAMRKTMDADITAIRKERFKMAKKAKKTKAEKKTQAAQKSGGGRRGIPIQGHPATAWIRTVAARGYNVEQVLKAAKKFAEGNRIPKEVTVKLNHRLRNNTEMPIAPLANRDWKAIRDLVGKPQGNEKKSATKTKKVKKQVKEQPEQKATKKTIKKRKAVKKKK